MSKPLILMGGGGHAAVLADCLLLLGGNVLGVIDPALVEGQSWQFGIKVLGEENVVFKHSPDDIELVNGLGFIPPSRARRDLFQRWTENGYSFASVVHPSAIIGRDVVLSSGVQVLAGVIINTGACIGDNTLINSGAVIEHHSQLGRDCHVAPGAVVCGGASMGVGCFVGVGSSVIQQQSLDDFTVVPAGTCFRGKAK